MSESEFERTDSEDGRDVDDILARLVTGPCPHPDCDGLLRRETYKDTDAVVCDACAVPAARIWGDER
jgi:hypothetical protein